MWAGFDPHRNPLLSILEAAVPGPWEVRTDSWDEVDLEVGSVYPRRSEVISSIAKSAVKRGLIRTPVDVREDLELPGKSPSARAGIWYTAENRRPPLRGWDAYLSFEPDSWPNNAYLPFWQLNSNLFGGSGTGLLGDTLRVADMNRSRLVRTSERRGFCCAILRHPEPVRMRAIESLSRVGPVDVFGPLARRPVPSKDAVLRNYRFALVFENDLYPGYITEKPFDSWHAETVPLYWGLDRDGTINPEAVLNMASMSGPDELVERVAEMEGDPQLIDDMASTPILQSVPSPNGVLELIRNTLNSRLSE